MISDADIGAGVEMATGAGVAVAADLGVPEQRLAQLLGGELGGGGVGNVFADVARQWIDAGERTQLWGWLRVGWFRNETVWIEESRIGTARNALRSQDADRNRGRDHRADRRTDRF